jgi:hypothetical protein
MIDVKEFFITRYKLFGFALQMWRHKHFLDAVLTTIKTNNPQLKMYDSDIQSMNAAAIGAKSWMAPQINRVCL